MSNLKKGVFGSILLVFDSFVNKAIGLVSTLILARVLIPEDFGIVAIAVLTMGFFEIIGNTGSVQYLLRAEKINDEDVNTSFTINIIIRFVLAFAIYLASFYVADFYQDIRLKGLLLALSFMFFIQAWQNPSIIYLKREQKFASIVKVNIVGKLVAVIAAVFVAVYFKSYWALVVGQATGVVANLFGYYLIQPYIPKFELGNAKKQWAFSGWMIPQSILGFFRTQLDTLIVSSIFGKSELGSYHTMKYIGFIPTSHFIIPMTETFLVEMRKAAGEVNKFSKVASASLLLTLLIAMPISAFLISFHENITNLLLGANWVKYSELLAAFGTLIPASAIHRHCCRVLIIYNKPKHILFYEIVTFLIIYSVLFIIGINDLYFFTYVRVGLEQVLSAFFLVYISCKYSNIITTGKLFLGIVIILLSCCVAISATQFVPVVSNYELINLSVFFFCFTMVFFVCFMLFFFTILQNFSEWNYISSLMNRLLTTFLHWVRDN